MGLFIGKLTWHCQKLASERLPRHHPNWKWLRVHPSPRDNRGPNHLARTVDHVVMILHCAISAAGNRQMQLNMDHHRCHNPPENKCKLSLMINSHIASNMFLSIEFCIDSFARCHHSISGDNQSEKLYVCNHGACLFCLFLLYFSKIRSMC